MGKIGGGDCLSNIPKKFLEKLKPNLNYSKMSRGLSLPRSRPKWSSWHTSQNNRWLDQSQLKVSCHLRHSSGDMNIKKNNPLFKAQYGGTRITESARGAINSYPIQCHSQ